MLRSTLSLMLVVALFGLAPIASEGGNVVWFQGFETDTSGWFPNGGSITRVASGTNGINSSEGNWHAIVEGMGPFSRFEGYNSVWPTYGWTACIDIFLDVDIALGQGFEYSVASNKQDNTHLRDFIFHVTKDTSTGKLLVAGSNNSNEPVPGGPRQNLETLNHYQVTTTGWYTFQHVFYDLGGTLAVDLNLLDSVGTVLWTETRNNASDLIATIVGGNRYSWFTLNNVTGGIAIDNHCREEVPEPTTLALVGAGVAALVGRRKRIL